MPSSSPKPGPKISSSMAMAELKTRILSSLSKLSDRDTHQIAVADLEETIKTLNPAPPKTLTVLLGCLLQESPFDSSSSPVLRRESLRLMSLLASTHPSAAAAHLPKMLTHVVRRLKDPGSDSSVRDACRDAAGVLAGLYVKGEEGGAAAVGVFVRPLMEAMGEQSRTVQAGAAACLARVVECGSGSKGNAGAAAAYGKICPRVCKMVSGQGAVARGAMLSVLASLSQVGAISPLNMPLVLQSVRECLDNSDWATRKAAADTLSVLASHSSHLVTDGAASIIAALEACRFDKVKPARDSIMEALQLWKKLIGKGEDISESPKDGKKSESIDPEEKVDNTKSNSGRRRSESVKALSATSSPTCKDSTSKEKGSNIPEQAVGILKKRMPSLTDKELNPEFFQKLETQSSVEVVVPRRCLQSSHSQGEEEPNMTDGDSVVPSKENRSVGHESIDSHARTSTSASNQNIEKRVGVYNKLQFSDDCTQDKWTEQRGFRAKDSKTRASDADDRAEQSQRDPFATRLNISRTDADGSFMNNKGNWLAIQRQLSQLERQQLNLMNMLQDFMGGSHDSMITLENRVCGLERVVEEMARDLSLSSGRRSSNAMLGFEGSPGRSSNKYNGHHDYSGPKFGRGVDGRMPFAERFLASDSILSGVRGRDPSWRPDSEAWDSYAYNSSRSGLMGSRRGLGGASVDGRSPRTEHEGDQPGSRRAWDKGQGPFRLGEGPSARSVWQASKDEATLEAIRVAGEDNGTARTARRETIRELDAEALTDDNSGQERGPLWELWSRAMDSLHVGDVDSAYAEVVSSGDDMLLVKLMERSGPVADQLSNEVASEVLHAVSQFLLEQSLLDTALAWIRQFTELIVENGADMGIPLEVKREVLFSLNEASAMEPPEDWEGAAPDHFMDQLASAWGINIHQLIK
ncbi:microtubule-associated protein TORTIFOLIA1-like [Iris pallida]|uniref:Microtubule-associated protein TORTIFOLIA1-like n=1 Tax=Iris pallida TaxID=29817 RepID=A0AAX6EFT5_IRIPA|nr:microtubule-associated protein TORTIFOLIA1-like [Iris pallida]